MTTESFDEREAAAAAKLCAACEHEANDQGTCVFCGALQPTEDSLQIWEPPIRRARLHQTHEPLLPSDHQPISGDFHDVNASAALCHVFGHIGGLLLATIGETVGGGSSTDRRRPA
jgi:hypothetical protein